MRVKQGVGVRKKEGQGEEKPRSPQLAARRGAGTQGIISLGSSCDGCLRVEHCIRSELTHMKRRCYGRSTFVGTEGKKLCAGRCDIDVSRALRSIT